MNEETPNPQEAAEVVETPEQGNKPELTQDERIAEVLARHEGQSAAPESAPKVDSVEEPKEEPADETPTEEVEAKPEEPTEPQPEPFTPEQIADPKHWDRLDKAGWERAEKLHPVETARVKAAYAAASRIAAAAQKEAKVPPAEERIDATQKSLADEEAELLAKMDSLNDSERAQAMREFTKRVVREVVPELTGIRPESVKAREIEGEAYRLAVAAVPEIANYSDKELDAVVEADAEMMADVELAVSLPEQQAAALLASVMKRAARQVGAQKAAAAADAEAKRKAEEARLADKQKRVRANANNPSNVLQTSNAARVPSGKRSHLEILEENMKRFGG